MYLVLCRILNRITNAIAPILEEELSRVTKTKEVIPALIVQAVKDSREVERRCLESGCGCPNCFHQDLAKCKILEAVEYEMGLSGSFSRYLPMYEKEIAAKVKR